MGLRHHHQNTAIFHHLGRKHRLPIPGIQIPEEKGSTLAGVPHPRFVKSDRNHLHCLWIVIRFPIMKTHDTLSRRSFLAISAAAPLLASLSTGKEKIPVGLELY